MLTLFVMKYIATRLALLAVACVLTACSAVTVTTDYDHAAPFAKYKTYAPEPAKKDQTLSPSSEAALREALRTELATRGIHEVSSSKADLAVVRHVFLEHNISVEHYTDWGYGYHGGWPYRYGYYGMWAGAPRTYVDVDHYIEGTLVLDFVDTHTRKLVFRGTGTAVVSDSEGNAENIREAIKKIVAALPTGASS